MNLILQEYAKKYQSLCDSYRATSKEFNKAFSMESDIVRVLYTISHFWHNVLKICKNFVLVFPFFVLGVVLRALYLTCLELLKMPFVILKRITTDQEYGLRNFYIKLKSLVFYLKHKKELDSLRIELEKEIEKQRREK